VAQHKRSVAQKTLAMTQKTHRSGTEDTSQWHRRHIAVAQKTLAVTQKTLAMAQKTHRSGTA